MRVAASLYIAIFLGAGTTFTTRGEVVFLLVEDAWQIVVRALAILTAMACLGFAVALVASSVNRYLESRCAPRA